MVCKKPITWIELLPKDCINCIRKNIAKNDYTQVLSELITITEPERNWIQLCKELDEYRRHDLYLNRYSIYQPNAGSGSLLKIYYYIQHVFSVNDYYECRNIREREITNNLLTMLCVRSTNLHSNSAVFEYLYDYIKYHINVVHDLIDTIALRYQQHVAVPGAFITRNCSSFLLWTDTEQSFRKYLSEDVMFVNYRNKIHNLLEIIQYNCGHLRTVRQQINMYIKLLYTVRYKRVRLYDQ